VEYNTYQEVYVKLFRIMSAMKNGAKRISEGMQLKVKNRTTKLVFQKCLETKSSFVLGLKLKPKTSEFAGYAGKIKKLMQRNGMGNLDTYWMTLCVVCQVTIGTALKKLGNCKDCTMGKLQQENRE